MQTQKTKQTKHPLPVKPLLVVFRRKRWRPIAGLCFSTFARAVHPRLYYEIRKRLARRHQELHLPGLSAPVNVYRDERGIPHIEAQTLSDVYRAQGYLTAQDRLWQMDMMRRLISGRLAEVMGSGAVASDKLFRAYSLRVAAEQSLKLYAPRVCGWMESYCAGTNTWINWAQKAGKLPIEFQLLTYEPEPWTPVDMLCIGKLLSYNLSQNLREEVFSYQLRRVIGNELLQQIMAMYPQNGPITVPNSQYPFRHSRSTAEIKRQHEVSDASIHNVLRLMDTASELSTGSNGWVVSGKLTYSGKPLLANDPHIELQTPSTWYQTHLIVTDGEKPMNVIGVTLPGICGIILGHNDKIAWGVTNNRADVQDLFIEKRNPHNQNQFEFQGKWEEAEIRHELIQVKGQPDIAFEVQVTRHGPILSEVMEHPDGEPSENALALQWVAHLPSTDLEAIFEMNQASNWEEFCEALRKYRTPVLNFLFASRDGTIAYRVGGSIPLRAHGEGLLPAPGWSGEYEWTGFIPFEELPEVVNPEQGYILNANNKVIDDSYPYLLTYSWDAPYRAQRILEMLQAQDDFTLENMSRMQGDLVDLQAKRLLPKLLPVLEKATLPTVERACLTLLQNWNHVDEAHQSAPLLYHFWWWEISKALLETKMGSFLFQRMVNRLNVTDEMLLRAADGNENDWVKDAGSFKPLIRTAFSRAVSQATKLYGSRPEVWTWGNYHHFALQHPIGQHIPKLAWLINPRGRHRIGGSAVTVCMAGFNRKTGRMALAAPWRMAVDLADMSGLDLNAPGQSGHHLSLWYDDQVRSFVQNKPKSQLFTHSQYQCTKHKIVLSP